MSLLFGVRATNQKNDAQSFRENIIQQPGSFYNSNPSSSIWGNPPPPIWFESSLADDISSPSSSAAVPFMLSTSSALKSSIGMADEQQWQYGYPMKRGEAMEEDLQEGSSSLRVEGHGYRQQNGKHSNSLRTSDPSSSPFMLGHLSQPVCFGSDRTNSSRFTAVDVSPDFVHNGKPLSDEGGRQADVASNASAKNEKSWKFGAVSDNFTSKSFLQSSTAPEVDSSSCGSSLNSSAVQQKSSLGVKTWLLENEFVCSDGNRPISSVKLEFSGINDSGPGFHEKKTPEVFVFGASGSGGSSFKSSLSQQRSFQGSFTASSSRSRAIKFKRHSNVVKGKGLAPLGGIGIEHFVPVFSRDASPQSNTGLEAAVESSHLDEAECSDAGIWPEDNIEASIDLEEEDFLQSDCMPERKAGMVMQNEGLCIAQEHLLSTDEESFSHGASTMQDQASSNQERQEDYFSNSQETYIPNWRTPGMRFSSWYPFQKKVDGDSRGDWEASGSLKTAKEEYNAAHVGDAMDEPIAAVEQADCGNVNFSVAFGKVPETGLQSQFGTSSKIPNQLEGRSSNSNHAGAAFVKEPTHSTGGYTADSTWTAGANDFSKLFVFGASQESQVQADHISEGFLGELGTASSSKNHKDENLQEGSEERISGSHAPSASLFFGTNLSTPFNKGPTKIDQQAFPFSPVFATSEPNTKIGHNLDFANIGRSSFTEHDNEGPTGEFSGPLSPSGSSASEGSPSRGEPWLGGDKPFNQTQWFEFQGSIKDGSTRMATGKKKSKVSTSLRRQVRGTTRGRKVAQSVSLKNTVTPMDFSPSAIDTEVRATTLEQPYFDFNGAKHTDDREFLRQLSEIQNMEEFAAAAARLNIGTDQDIANFEAGKQANEGPTDWADHNLSSKRSGKWKRRGLDEGSSAYQESRGLAEHIEREGMSEIYDYSLKQEDSNFGLPSTFGASSSHTNSSTMDHRYAQGPQKENPTQTFEGSTTQHGPVGSGSSNYDSRQSQAKLGPALSFPPLPFGVLRPSTLINHQNQSYLKSTEEPALTNMDSSHGLVQGIVGSPNAVKSAAAEQVCETWRLRGNQAYANGDFPKAEEYYSRGASSVSPDETSQSCIRASMLCYSNRAATRMAVGRMREALADCKRAMVVDPGFLRVRLRAASCHLALGESKAAADIFKECVKYAKESVKPDSKILAEALEGVKKSQQLDEYYDRALELLQKQTSLDSTSALRILDEALSISSFSEPLHELKAQVLLSLRRYEECLQFCDQTLAAAERNHGSAVYEKYQDSNVKEARQGHENYHLKLWRWRLSAKALYHLGKLEDALDLVVKHEGVLSASSREKTTNSESLAPFLASIRYMLRHKAAGNEAFQLGKHAEAVEHYTAALACNGDSRPFNAVCFCNRAAASQALGHIADAIADCSRAIALDAAYPKALSRRATLHEMIRDYGQACNDLRRLIGLLEDYQAIGKNNQTTKGLGSSINAQDLRQARDRLEKGEEEMKKGHPIDHYLVLGVDFSCSANEIKKAYRKAALKHHPDKAGQFLARNENGDDGGIWKEVGDEVRRDAERLFKLIGEAYAILSDPTKRLRYDMDEENRKLRGKDTSEGYRSQFEKSGRRQRDRWDAWQGYAPQHQRWQSGPDAAQPDTYGRKSTYGADPAKTGKATWNTDFSWDKI